MLSSGNLGVESLHALRPQSSVGVEPNVNLLQRLGAQDVNTELCLLAHLDESSVTQNPQVSRGSWTGDWQQRRQLTGGSRSLAQSVQHDSPAWIGERLENGVHRAVVTLWVRNCQGTYPVTT